MPKSAAPPSPLPPSELANGLSHTCPDQTRVNKQLLMSVEIAGWEGNMDVCINLLEEMLLKALATMTSNHFASAVPSKVFNESSKRLCSQLMGCSKPLKRQKTMHATNSITHLTKTACRQVCGGMTQVGMCVCVYVFVCVFKQVSTCPFKWCLQAKNTCLLRMID